MEDSELEEDLVYLPFREQWATSAGDVDEVVGFHLFAGPRTLFLREYSMHVFGGIVRTRAIILT